MKILVLSKRHYMSKDLLLDRYGRFFAIPEAIVALGASVKGVCLEYRTAPLSLSEVPGKVGWQSFSARSPSGINGYLSCIHALLQKWQPDIIWATSDSMHVAFGVVLQKLRKTACIIDLYDHFDAYPANRFPGVSLAYHTAVANATGVTCVSPPLADWANTLRPSGAVGACVLENAIAREKFCYLDRSQCLARLGLEGHKQWIGTAGALTSDRGIETLYFAWEKLRKQHPDWGLALAGPKDILPPRTAKYLGMLSHDEVPFLFGALSVGVICNIDSLFARFCFPQKLYEMLACGIPIVAANVGVLASGRWDGAVFTYTPGNSEDLANQIEKAMLTGKISSPSVPPNWSDRAASLLTYIENSVMRQKAVTGG